MFQLSQWRTSIPGTQKTDGREISLGSKESVASSRSGTSALETRTGIAGPASLPPITAQEMLASSATQMSRVTQMLSQQTAFIATLKDNQGRTYKLNAVRFK